VITLKSLQCQLLWCYDWLWLKSSLHNTVSQRDSSHNTTGFEGSHMRAHDMRSTQQVTFEMQFVGEKIFLETVNWSSTSSSCCGGSTLSDTASQVAKRRLDRHLDTVLFVRYLVHKWGMVPSVACECGVEQTIDHVVLHCPIHRPPMECMAWRFRMTGQSNSCSTPVPRSSAA